MELWIRSQDRERICKVNKLYIKGVGIYSNCDNYNDDYDYLGIYKTKERALEVLDEIQNIIIGKYMTNLSFEASFSKFDDEEATRKALIAMAVYEMPKE